MSNDWLERAQHRIWPQLTNPLLKPSASCPPADWHKLPKPSPAGIGPSPDFLPINFPAVNIERWLSVG
jgi:hypothetical protein